MNRPRPPGPRKRPRQSRSLMLVKAIQQACLQILEEEGPDQLTTQRIADVAGVNIASLYQYFPNKEAVLAEVFDEQVAQLTRAARDRFMEIDQMSRASLTDTLAAIVDWEVEQRLTLHRMEPAFYRAYSQNFDVHRRIDELTISLSNPGWSEWFPRFLAFHRDQLRSDDIDTLSRIASHALAGVLHSAVTEDPELLKLEAFKQEVTALLLGYLCRQP